MQVLLNKISLYTVTLLARQPTVLMSDESLAVIVISINNLFKLPELGAGVILVTFLCISYGRKVKVNVFVLFFSRRLASTNLRHSII